MHEKIELNSNGTCTLVSIGKGLKTKIHTACDLREMQEFIRAKYNKRV